MSVESSQFPDVKRHGDERASPAKDFDDLLELGETLQERGDRVTQRVFMYRMFQAALLLTGAGIYQASSVLGSDGSIALYYTVFVITGVAVGYCLAVERMLRKITTRRKRDQRALHEVVELLRETERSVAVDQGLSVLQRAKLRVQLSRLDI